MVLFTETIYIYYEALKSNGLAQLPIRVVSVGWELDTMRF